MIVDNEKQLMVDHNWAEVGKSYRDIVIGNKVISHNGMFTTEEDMWRRF